MDYEESFEEAPGKQEKRNMEFFYPGLDLWFALSKYKKPGEGPFNYPVNVNVRYIFKKTGTIMSDTSPVYVFAYQVAHALKEMDFIRDVKQIRSLTVEKNADDFNGITFFMQEVE